MMPKNTPLDIIDLIREGHDPDPDNRFTPQNIFTRLILIREKVKINSYTVPITIHSSYTSLKTTVTDETVITATDSLSEHSSTSDTTSNSTNTASKTNDYDDSYDENDEENTDESDGGFPDVEVKYSVDGGDIILQGEIGRVSLFLNMYIHINVI